MLRCHCGIGERSDLLCEWVAERGGLEILCDIRRTHAESQGSQNGGESEEEGDGGEQNLSERA